MILILLPHLGSSQTATINPESETVTLDKDKTIDVAKIIENEKRLKTENAELLETIRKQDSTINDLANKNISGIRKLEEQGKRILELSNDVIRLSGMQLDYEEKKKDKPSMFLRAGGNYFKRDELFMPYLGAVFTTKRIGFEGNIGMIEDSVFYGGGLLITLF